MANSEELQIIVKAYNEASKALDEANESIKKIGSTAEEAEVKSNFSFNKLNAGFNRAGQSIANVGKTLTLGLTLPIVGFGVTAIKEFGEFNESIRRAGTFVNATEDQIKSFGDAAIKAAKGTKFTALEAADALGSFVGGEISAEEATSNLANVIDLALIAKMDNLQDAVSLSGSSLSIFGKEGLTMANVMDTMASVASNVTTNTQSYSNVLGQVSGAANAANLSFKETNELISALVAGGVNMNLAAAAINSAFISIQEPLKGADTALSEFGLSMTGLQTAFEAGPIDMMKYLKTGFDEATKAGVGFNFLVNVLGKQAAPEFAVALSQTSDSLDNVSGYFDNAAGSGAIMVQKLREGQDPTVSLTKAINDLQIAIGKNLSPAITPLITKLTDLTGNFSRLTPATQNSIVQLAGLLAVLGPVAFAIGKVMAFLNPLTAALAVCSAAAAGMATTNSRLMEGLYGLLGPVPQIIFVFKHLRETIDHLTGAFSWLWDKVTGTIDKLGTLFNLAIGRSITIPINYQENLPAPTNYTPVSGSDQAGSDFVPRTGMYMLHRGEQVIPTSEASGGANGGARTINVNFNNPVVRAESDLEEIKKSVIQTLGRDQELNQLFGVKA